MKGLELGTSPRDSKYFWKNITLDYTYQLIMCCGLIIYNSKDASKKDPFKGNGHQDITDFKFQGMSRKKETKFLANELRLFYDIKKFWTCDSNEVKYSRMDQVKFFKGCLL